MFTMNNTDGYTAQQLAAFNEELAQRLEGVEPGSDEAHQIAKALADDIASR